MSEAMSACCPSPTGSSHAPGRASRACVSLTRRFQTDPGMLFLLGGSVARSGRTATPLPGLIVRGDALDSPGPAE